MHGVTMKIQKKTLCLFPQFLHFKTRGLSSIVNGNFLNSVYSESKAPIRDSVRTDRTFISRKMPKDLRCVKPHIRQF